MTWTPDPTITIGGVDYTGDTLETVRIRRGRDTVYQEPRAGYLIAELIDLDGDGLDFDVLDTVQVTLDDSAGSPVTVFTGKVSDWSAVLYDTGVESGTAKAVYTIIAVGPLATLNRRNVLDAGRAQEKDGDRIAALISTGLARSWEETPGTWATVAEATTTWDTIDAGYDPDRIDTPGVYEIAALDATDEGYNPLAEGYLTAVSGRGVLWDDPDGYVAYADADRRENAAASDGYLDIPKANILAGDLQASSVFADIVNRVVVAYDGGDVRVSDAESILEYGVLASSFTTRLADQSAAEDWALDYIEDHAGPVINLGTVGLRLDLISDDTLRDEILTLDVNSPVALEDLPGTLGIINLPAFVEGLDWAINRQAVQLNLNLSDAALSVGSIRWNLVPQTLTWDDVPATLTWEAARSI